MKIKLNHSLLICLLFMSNLLSAQEKNSPVVDTINFLLPKFTDGSISMKDGSMSYGMLNYNTILDEMQFLDPKNGIMSLAEPEKVVKVVIGTRNFIFLKNTFVEFISEGPVSLLLRVHVNRTADKIGAYGGVSYGSSIESMSTYRNNEGSMAKLSANEKVSYQRELIYYVMYNDKLKVIYNLNDLLKCFSSNKDKVKQEMDKQSTKFNSIDSMIKIIKWINENGIKN